MNSKLLGGSVLSGFGLLGAVAHGWAQRFFFTQYHIARGTSLEGAGEFNPGPYGIAPESTTIFLGTRIAIWAVLLLGIALVLWGIVEDRRQSDRVARPST